MNHSADIAVVIRSADERTKKLCQVLVEQQVPESLVAVVEEHPFARAIVKGYDAALELNAKWTLFLDADILIKSNAVSEFMAVAGSLDIFCFVTNLLDKFRGEPVVRGAHFYRTKYLREVRELVSFDKRLGKPETYVCRQMQAKGYLFLPLGIISGLHDFEQSYQHIYIKNFNRAKRGMDEVPFLMERFQALAEDDDDFKVAIVALEDSMANPDSIVYLDFASYPDITPVLDRLGLKEKECLNVGEFGDFPDRLLSECPSLRYQRPTVSELYWKGHVKTILPSSVKEPEDQPRGLLARIKSMVMD